MIDELPDLPFNLIWKELSYEDRFGLRATCKKLKHLSDRQVYRNLFIFLDSYPCHKYLFHTNELVYYSNSCRVPDFGRFISSKYKEPFRSLKKLTFFFEGINQLPIDLKRREISVKTHRQKSFFQEVWRVKINLKDLNFFEQVKHLEIKAVGKVFGQLKLKNLKILSVETRRPSEFDLECEQLSAMCISVGARPNFLNLPNNLKHLSIELLQYRGLVEYLCKLYGQCSNLSTIGFKYPISLSFTLQEVNRGHISLPLFRVVQLNQPQYPIPYSMVEDLVDFEKSIEPGVFQFIFNNQQISLEQFSSTLKAIHEFKILPDKLNHDYLNFLKSETVPYASCFLWDRSCLNLDDGLEFDEEMVMKFKLLKELIFSPRWKRLIDKTLFQTMLTSWPELDCFWVINPSEQIGQHLLEQMTSYWPNLQLLALGKEPKDLKFVTNFRNLKALKFCFYLPRKETVFLMQACPSLYYIEFKNEQTNLVSFLSTKNPWKYASFIKYERFVKYANFYKYASRAVNRYAIKHRPNENQCYTRRFDSLKQLIDFYYDNDLFNNPIVTTGDNIRKALSRFLGK